MIPTNLFSVSGNETEFIEYIKEMVGGETDNLGSLVVKRPGNGKKIAISCFVDEPGVFVTDTSDGIRFALIGKAEPSSLKNRTVRFKDGTMGVICSKKTDDLKIGDMFIVADGDVKIGDVARFELDEIKNGNKISGFSVDKGAVVSVVTSLLESLGNSEYVLTFMFTTMYKIGKKGLYASILENNPDYTIVVDTASCDKIKCGCGPVVKVTEGSYTADNLLHSFAKEKGMFLTAMKDPEIPAPNSFMVGGVCGYVSIPAEKNDGFITIDTTDVDKTTEFIKEFVAKINEI